MTVQLHVLSLPPVLFAGSQALAQSFYSMDIDELRVPLADMEPFAAQLGEALGEEFPAHQLITVDVEPGKDDRISQVLSLAHAHGLMVLAGESGALLDATGSVYGETSLYRLLNTVNSSWTQVAPWTIDEAFLDALRRPAGDPCELLVEDLSSSPEDKAEYGTSMTAALRPDGGFDVEWGRLTDEGPRLDSVRVDTFAEARDLLMQFVDRAPTLKSLPWQPTEGMFMSAASLEQRLKLPLERLEGVFELPAGTTVRLHDFPDAPLTYGTTQEGKPFASVEKGAFVTGSKVFASPQEVLGLVQAYRGGGMAHVFSTLDEDQNILGKDLITVTAMVPPHRDEYWLNSSILAFHRDAMERAALGEQRPVDTQMELFVKTLNEDLGQSLILAETEVEEAEVVTLMIPAETAGVTVERLVHTAQKFAVSLVVAGAMVLHNPSRSALEGSHDFPLSLLDGNMYLQNWAVTTPTTLLEAFTAFGPSLSLNCEEPPTVAAGERDEAGYWFTPEGPVFCIADADGARHTLDNPTTVDVVRLFLSFVEDADYLKKNFPWSQVTNPNEEAATRFLICYPNGTYAGTEENFATVRELGLPDAGRWVCLRDQKINGDYFQIDNVGDGRFLVEWGHNLGEDECFQAYRNSIGEAFELMDLYMRDDRTEFESVEWTRQV